NPYQPKIAVNKESVLGRFEAYFFRSASMVPISLLESQKLYLEVLVSKRDLLCLLSNLYYKINI
ncbi:MAG: hypothetical protein ACI9IA_000772, partial [Enterobacterales bacterium]